MSWLGIHSMVSSILGRTLCTFLVLALYLFWSRMHLYSKSIVQGILISFQGSFADVVRPIEFYFGNARLAYPRRRRESVYHWIQNLAERISIGLGKDVITPTAWRIAAKQWLLENGLIQVVKAGKVLPNLS